MSCFARTRLNPPDSSSPLAYSASKCRTCSGCYDEHSTFHRWHKPDYQDRASVAVAGDIDDGCVVGCCAVGCCAVGCFQLLVASAKSGHLKGMV